MKLLRRKAVLIYREIIILNRRSFILPAVFKKLIKLIILVILIVLDEGSIVRTLREEPNIVYANFSHRIIMERRRGHGKKKEEVF
jgi:hypothetical protein